VRSYFRRSGDGRFRIQFLIPNVEDLEFLVTDSEKETLIKWIASALMRTSQSFHKPYHESQAISRTEWLLSHFVPLKRLSQIRHDRLDQA
jgi:excinuclease UvrABC nuclease subunit